jgi:fucose permease
MEREGQSRLMNLLHAMFCVGAIVGPVAVGFISGTGASMLTVFLGAGILLVLLGVLFGLVRFPRASQEKTSRAEPGPRLLREPILAILTLLLLVYVGSEIGVSTWSSEYIVQTIGATAYQGAYAVGLVWAGLLAGRLLVSFLYKGRRQEILMLGLSALSTAMILVVLLVHSPWAILAALFLTGLGFSAFYPLAMSLVGRYYKSGVAVGWAASGGGVGSIAFPLLMSVMAQTVGIRAGFWFYLGLNCLLVALTGVLVRLVRHRAAPAA